jgi:hypothetical protein
VPYTYGQPYAVAPRKNGLGIASMVLGIVGVVVPCFWILQIPGVLAVVFGAVALSQLKKQPEKYTGRGMAVAGLVLGLVALVIMLLFIVFGNFHLSVNDY